MTHVCCPLTVCQIDSQRNQLRDGAQVATTSTSSIGKPCVTSIRHNSASHPGMVYTPLCQSRCAPTWSCNRVFLGCSPSKPWPSPAGPPATAVGPARPGRREVRQPCIPSPKCSTHVSCNQHASMNLYDRGVLPCRMWGCTAMQDTLQILRMQNVQCFLHEFVVIWYKAAGSCQQSATIITYSSNNLLTGKIVQYTVR
jgi:hypothetical protein